MMATTGTRPSVLVELSGTREMATRLCELAEDAYASIAALEAFVKSRYFQVDGVALGEIGDQYVADSIKNRITTIEENAKSVDRLSASELLSDGQELLGFNEQAIRHCCSRDDES